MGYERALKLQRHGELIINYLNGINDRFTIKIYFQDNGLVFKLALPTALYLGIEPSNLPLLASFFTVQPKPLTDQG